MVLRDCRDRRVVLVPDDDDRLLISPIRNVTGFVVFFGLPHCVGKSLLHKEASGVLDILGEYVEVYPHTVRRALSEINARPQGIGVFSDGIRGLAFWTIGFDDVHQFVFCILQTGVDV
ncbi:MAG: hypothetical protein ACRDTI_09405 [Mycobacterium sp.]